MGRPRLRPVFTALLVIATGIGLAPFVPFSIPWLYLLAILSLCLAFILRSHQTLSVLFLYAPLLFVGIARAEQSMVPAPHDVSRWQGQPSLWYQGTVDSDVRRGSRGQAQFTLAVSAVYDYTRIRPATGYAVVSVDPLPARIPATGEVLWLRGRITKPEPATNPGSFDYREYLRRRGIFSLLHPKSPADIEFATSTTKLPWYRQWSAALRSHILKATARYLSPDDATLMNGLLLSAHLSTQNRMRVDLTEAFASTGTVHLLSVSGFHLTLLATCLALATRLLSAPRPAKNLLCIGLLWLFVLASGGSTPAIRSAIMATLIFAAPLARRHAEPLHSLAAAAVGILLAQPGSLYDPGFQLSFTVTATLALWLPPLFRLPAFRYEPAMGWAQRIPWLILSGLLVGIIAEWGTAPLTAYHYNRFSLISPLASVPLGLLAELLLIGGLGASLLSFLPGFLIAPLWWILSLGLGLLRFLTFAYAGLPWASLAVGSPPVFVLVLYYLALGGAALVIREKIGRKILLQAAPAPGKPPAPPRMPPRET